MSTRRLYYALGVIALASLFALAGRAALRAGAPQTTEGLSREIKALENAPVDSGTRSYMAWAKAFEGQQNSQIDSATRSYMAWAKAVEGRQNSELDSATRSYMAWAQYIEEQQNAARPATTP